MAACIALLTYSAAAEMAIHLTGNTRTAAFIIEALSMAKLFRLACAIDSYISASDRYKRPPKPTWLRDGNRQNATRNQAHSYNYWTKIYWAAPPWITLEQIDQMRKIYTLAPAGHHVDHIVPLSSPIVCGLHVPWNLQHLPDKQNLHKSNDMWPGHPCEHDDLFGDYEPQQLKLTI